MSSKEIEVQILGKNFNFNVPENIKEDVFLEIIDYVENKYGRIRKDAGDLDAFRLGLLVAVNIAEEFFYVKNENEQFRAVLTNIDNMLPPAEQEGQLPIRFSS